MPADNTPYLYLLWIGPALVISVFVFFVRIFSGDLRPDWLDRWMKWAIIMVFAAAVAILVDKFVLPYPGVNDYLVKRFENFSAIRFLLFPIFIIIFYLFSAIGSLLRPAESNLRFQRDVGGTSSWGLVLGFVLMVFACLYGNKQNPLGRYVQKNDRKLPNLSRSEEVSKVIERVKTSLDPISDEFDNLRTQIFSTLGSFKNPLEQKQTEDNLVNQGLNLPNYKAYRTMISEVAEKNGVPADLILAIVAVESKFNPDFQSPDGGYGLMNVTANLARQLNIEDFRQPENNLEIGCKTIRAQLDLFGDDKIDQVLAAYHFGTVKISKNPELIKNDNNIARYVQSVKALRANIGKL